MLNEKLHNELAAFLKANYHEFDEESKYFFDEAYTDYDDQIRDKDLGEILASEDPEEAFEEMLWDCYTGCEWQYRDDIVSGFLKTPEGSKYDYTTLPTAKINVMQKGFWKPFIRKLSTAQRVALHYSFRLR